MRIGLTAVTVTILLAGCEASSSVSHDPVTDDAYIRALTTGAGVRADVSWVNSWPRDILISAGRNICDRLKAGDGLIEASAATMDRFSLPPGENGIVAVSHAATEVYCPGPSQPSAQPPAPMPPPPSSVPPPAASGTKPHSQLIDLTLPVGSTTSGGPPVSGIEVWHSPLEKSSTVAELRPQLPINGPLDGVPWCADDSSRSLTQWVWASNNEMIVVAVSPRGGSSAVSITRKPETEGCV